jgi:hypothetical protein
MPAGVPILNTQDILAGAIVKVEYADWVANYGAAAFTDIGAIKDPKFTTEIQDMDVDADNAFADLASVNTKLISGLELKCLQQNLRTRAMALGKPSSDVVVTPRAPATSKGTAVLGVGQLPTTRYLTLRVTMSINTVPGYSEAPNDNYILTTILIARAKAKVKEEREFGKAKVTIQSIQFRAYHDSSVVTAGHEVWKQTDETAL